MGAGGWLDLKGRVSRPHVPSSTTLVSAAGFLNFSDQKARVLGP
jgi:hypothetical protein